MEKRVDGWVQVESGVNHFQAYVHLGITYRSDRGVDLSEVVRVESCGESNEWVGYLHRDINRGRSELDDGLNIVLGLRCNRIHLSRQPRVKVEMPIDGGIDIENRIGTW